MFKKVLTSLSVVAAIALVAPGFARPPTGMGHSGAMGMGHASAGEQAVDVAKGNGEEKGEAKGEQHGRDTHQDKHRGRNKHQDKHRGEESHQKP